MKKRSPGTIQSMKKPRKKTGGADRYLQCTEKLLRRRRSLPGYGGFYELVYLRLQENGSIIKGGPVIRNHTDLYRNFYLNVVRKLSAMNPTSSVREKDGVYRVEKTTLAPDSPELQKKKEGSVHERLVRIVETIYERAESKTPALRQAEPLAESPGMELALQDFGAQSKSESSSAPRVRDLIYNIEREHEGTAGEEERDDVTGLYHTRRSRSPEFRGRARDAMPGLTGRSAEAGISRYLAHAQSYDHAARYSQIGSLVYYENTQSEAQLSLRHGSLQQKNSSGLVHKGPESSREQEAIMEKHEPVVARASVKKPEPVTITAVDVVNEIINDSRGLQKMGNHFFRIFEERMAREFERRGM